MGLGLGLGLGLGSGSVVSEQGGWLGLGPHLKSMKKG